MHSHEHRGNEEKTQRQIERLSQRYKEVKGQIKKRILTTYTTYSFPTTLFGPHIICIIL